MKITIDSGEIESAVECYLARQGVAVDSYELTIQVTAGRADSGPRIEIDMVQKLEPIEDVVPKAPFGSEDD